MSEEIRMSGLDLEELDAQSAELLPDRVEMATARASARRRSAAAAVAQEAEQEAEGDTTAVAVGGDAEAFGHENFQDGTAVAINEANN